MNYLATDNCNKSMCKSCVFRTDDQAVRLFPERKKEIENYLTTFQSSHVCHVTQKTCYGGLMLQAKAMNELGMIEDDKVSTFLEAAEKYLNL